jgi:hypothetical protein
MKKSKILYLFGSLMLLISACSINKTITLETPFAIVVKLMSAENTLKYEEAKQYIDVVQVYTKLGSENPEEGWKEWLKFQYNLGKDKKFTNEFAYYNYDIKETIRGNNASVCFKNKDKDADIKKIIYELEKRQNKWIVISIDYLK